jgi:AraC family transcriptional regulator of adaptative response / DNA-3-methyladenine glycosylase II
MFDLDADPRGIEDTLSACRVLGPFIRRRPGLRIPGGWDGFEMAVRSTIGRLAPPGAACSLTSRLTDRFGTTLSMSPAPGIERLFPTPDSLADADLASIGLPVACADAVRTISRAIVEGKVDFNREHTLEDFVERWTALPAVGRWTAHYLALRALGHPDAFPVSHTPFPQPTEPNDRLVGPPDVFAAAEAWRPWRGYAAVHLWRHGGAD